MGVFEVKLAISHRWDLTVDQARELQAQLAQKVIAETTFNPTAIQTVAGVDVGFRSGIARAAVVVLAFPTLEPVDSAMAEVPVTFPYVPGLLAFREGPGVLAALDKLTIQPDLFIFDAQGVAHPRRLGLAAHLGIVLDRPSIGCAKSRLVGTHGEPGNKAGDWVYLYDESQVTGAVLRSRAGAKPLYVSIGHRVDLTTAVKLVVQCTQGYRLPETTRYAHKVAGGAQLQLGAGQPPAA